MKMVFLFEKELRPKFRLSSAVPAGAIPDFKPYDYGPFSSDVFSDLEFLVELGFVQVRRLGDEAGAEEQSEYEYWQAAGADRELEEGPVFEEEFSLTPLGRDFVEDREAGTLTTAQWAALDDFKSRCLKFPLRALLRYVYMKYPLMTTQSRIRDKVVPQKEAF
jgi:uncharacterized protein YwgA